MTLEEKIKKNPFVVIISITFLLTSIAVTVINYIYKEQIENYKAKNEASEAKCRLEIDKMKRKHKDELNKLVRVIEHEGHLSEEEIQTLLRPVVYIHIMEESQINIAKTIGEFLNEEGYIIPERFRCVDSGPGKDEVRFFRKGDRKKALEIMGLIESIEFTGLKKRKLILKEHLITKEKVKRPNFYEIWLCDESWKLIPSDQQQSIDKKFEKLEDRILALRNDEVAKEIMNAVREFIRICMDERNVMFDKKKTLKDRLHAAEIFIPELPGMISDLEEEKLSHLPEFERVYNKLKKIQQESISLYENLKRGIMP